jgi:poly(glycerol-phosphate) alpha-glucosyltransferase
MRVAINTVSVSRLAGGLFESVPGLHLAQLADGLKCRAFAMRDAFSTADSARWDPIKVSLFDSRFPLFHYAKALPAALEGFKPDIVHSHGLWQGSSLAAVHWRHKTKKPTCVSPRGMLDPWALQQSKFTKKILRYCFEDAHLEGASFIHALCQSEWKSIRDLGLRNPVAVIPNGIAIPVTNPFKFAKKEGRILLFLGRLHPKKGLFDLLKALAVVKILDRNWQLVIAGWDQEGHELDLKKCCDELRISWMDAVCADPGISLHEVGHGMGASVLFTGPVFGATKTAVLEQADAFILPSFSEGLPMAVLEAWAHGLPVVMTPECNLPEGVQAGAALEITTGGATPTSGARISAIRQSLEILMEMSLEDRRAMGAAGRRLVENRFSWPQVARQMTEVYQWVAGGGAKPDTVQ